MSRRLDHLAALRTAPPAPPKDKARENRARRMAERRGLRLVRSRVRDPLALTFGLWDLQDAEGRSLSDGLTLTLDQVEAALDGREF